jgi:hypothetical protein
LPVFGATFFRALVATPCARMYFRSVGSLTGIPAGRQGFAPAPCPAG